MNDKIQALVRSLTECINCLTPGRDDAEMKRARRALKLASALRPATAAEIQEARDTAGEDVQIDDDAVVSEIEGYKNIWVSAWVYVRKDV